MRTTLTLLCTLPLLYACQEKPKPIKNPKPKYFVTIKGIISPKLKYPMHLAFWAHYSAFNPKCQVTSNWLEGVKGMPAVDRFYLAKPDAKGHYQIRIPIDAFKKGKCDWMAEGIDYVVSFKPVSSDYSKTWSKSDLMRFGSIKNGMSPLFPIENSATLKSCIVKSIASCKGLTLSASYSKTTQRNKNYQFTQNIF